ncbi:MAG: hypothetical protein HXS48_26355 [Theionarchaea archaeon]|nr:hypothetical protein [Theionarchaea archaeon]
MIKVPIQFEQPLLYTDRAEPLAFGGVIYCCTHGGSQGSIYCCHNGWTRGISWCCL